MGDKVVESSIFMQKAKGISIDELKNIVEIRGILHI